MPRPQRLCLAPLVLAVVGFMFSSPAFGREPGSAQRDGRNFASQISPLISDQEATEKIRNFCASKFSQNSNKENHCLQGGKLKHRKASCTKAAPEGHDGDRVKSACSSGEDLVSASLTLEKVKSFSNHQELVDSMNKLLINKCSKDHPVLNKLCIEGGMNKVNSVTMDCGSLVSLVSIRMSHCGRTIVGPPVRDYEVEIGTHYTTDPNKSFVQVKKLTKDGRSVKPFWETGQNRKNICETLELLDDQLICQYGGRTYSFPVSATKTAEPSSNKIGTP